VASVEVHRTLFACVPYVWHLRNDSGSIVAADFQRLDAGLRSSTLKARVSVKACLNMHDNNSRRRDTPRGLSDRI